MPFLLNNEPTSSEMSEAINYLLANFGANLSADPNSGQISGPSGIIIAYLYQYIAIKYADSADGSVNFSNVPTNRQYYGIRNTNSTVESTNSADYIWNKVAGGFGTTKFLFYQTGGGRQINFVAATTAPDSTYLQDPGTSIDLDVVTTTTAYNTASPSIYIWTSTSTPPARPTATSIYTWATGAYTAPAGWTKTPVTNTTPGSYLWAITIPLVVNSNVTTSTLDWTNVSYPIYAFSYNGAVGATGGNGLSSLTAYLVQSQSGIAPSTPSNTTGPTAPSGWSLTAPSVAVGQVLWYSFGRYNSSSATIDGVPAGQTAWGTPTAASIFQDIRSDNWNGSNPPVAGTPATYGTAGYYIQRSTGDMFLNSIYARGVARFDGTNSASGSTYSLVANSSLNTQGGIISYSSTIFTGAMAGYGSGSAFGGYFQTTGSQAALASSTSGSGAALQVNGPMTMFNSTVVTNLNADLLDGNHSSAFATTALGYPAYGADRLNGSAGVNVMRFVGGTSTGASVATFNGAAKPGSSSTNVWMTITIDTTTLYIPVWT